MVITKVNIKLLQPVSISGKDVELVSVFGLLGVTVTLDQHLTFRTHVTSIIDKSYSTHYDYLLQLKRMPE